MKHIAEVGQMRIVANLPEYFDYQFVSDSQDVQTIKEHVGPTAQDYDSFFVLAQDGDYLEVWAMVGIVPRKGKFILRIV